MRGSAFADTITAGNGIDLITGLAGNDVFVQPNGSSAGSTGGWTSLTNNAIVGGASIIDFGPTDPIDNVTDFSSANDKLDASVAGATNAATVANLATAAAGNYYVIGIYNSANGEFLATNGPDVLFYVTTGVDQTVPANIGTTSIVLSGGAAGFSAAVNII